MAEHLYGTLNALLYSIWFYISLYSNVIWKKRASTNAAQVSQTCIWIYIVGYSVCGSSATICISQILLAIFGYLQESVISPHDKQLAFNLNDQLCQRNKSDYIKTQGI